MQFDVLWKDTVVSHVTCTEDDPLVHVISYSDNIVENPLHFETITKMDLDTFIQSRCFEKCNANCEFFLKDMGLSSYNPWEIVKITHGFMWEDFTWIRFEGETLQWRDINHGRV